MNIKDVDRPIAISGTEPITLEWAKHHLRFRSSAEDDVLTTYISAARGYFEEQTGRSCIDAEWEYALDVPPAGSVIELPRPPLSSVVSIVYDDGDGVEQTFDAASYIVHPSIGSPHSGSPSDPVALDAYCGCGWIELASGASWPSTSGRARSFRIRRICGYGATADAMPPMIQATIGMLVQFFHSRELGDLPPVVQSLIDGFKWTAIQTQPPVDRLPVTSTQPITADWWATTINR